MLRKLRSEYTEHNDSLQLRILSDIFEITTQKSATIHSKANSLRNLIFQLRNLDKDLKLHEKALAMFLLKSLGEEFDTTRDMILVSARKTRISLDEIFSILASKETELNDPLSARDGSSDVVNFAGRKNGRGDSRSGSRPKIGTGVNSKPLYCIFHRQAIGHIQNDCPDYLKTEPGKRWLKSDAGIAANTSSIAAKSSDDDDEYDVLNMVKQVKLENIYETDDSAYSYVPRETVYAIHKVISCPNWYLDTCASRHITPNRDLFKSGSLKPYRISIKCADNKFIVFGGIGDVELIWENDNRSARSLTKRDVLYIPNASDNLISIGMLVKKGINIQSYNTKLYLFKTEISNPLLIGVITGAKIWKVQRIFQDFAFTTNDIQSLSRHRSQQELLHARLGHMGDKQGKRINSMVQGLENIKIRPCVCNACTKAKITRTVSRKPMSKVFEPGGRLHIDLFGPLPCKSLQENRIMIALTDQYTKMVEVQFLPNKKAESILNSLKSYIVRSETTFRKQGLSYQLRCVHCDRGKEFLNNAFAKFLEGMRCDLEYTIGYTPEANGIAERCNRIFLEEGQALRIEAGLPEELWGFAFKTTTYLRNRSAVLNRAVTPWEAWYGLRPGIKHLRVFGCPVVVHIPKEKRIAAGTGGKLAIKGWDGIFVDYIWQTTSEYVVWDPLTRKARKTRHLQFDEWWCNLLEEL
ncbi:hypothetical protein K3495_g13698 [Podosphaera aphanis]|nr:hypothetical protein K3495_g13698 [Podosphaera aphanis]